MSDVACRLLCPWDFTGKNTEVGWHFLLQGLFMIQGSNLGSSTLQEDSLPSEPSRKPLWSLVTENIRGRLRIWLMEWGLSRIPLSGNFYKGRGMKTLGRSKQWGRRSDVFGWRIAELNPFSLECFSEGGGMRTELSGKELCDKRQSLSEGFLIEKLIIKYAHDSQDYK